MSNIWIAASDNKISLVKNLIESGNFTPTSKDPNGYTPIHAAASYGHIELLKYLVVEQKGDINVQDNDGDTPLHHVESVDTATVLIGLGADLKIKNADGLTAAKYQEEEDEFPELIEYLLAVERTGEAPISGTSNAVESATEESITLPNGEKVQYVLSNDAGDQDLNDEETIKRRQELENIMTSDLNEEEKEEKLKEYVMGVVSGNLPAMKGEDADEQDSKRRK